MVLVGLVGNAFRAALQNPALDIEFVAINDLTSPETLAHLLQYDLRTRNLIRQHRCNRSRFGGKRERDACFC